ncbi:helix-turn-helix domain-containing protein [Enterococcus innesii]|uniref:helix-turn-helix domain-containing protein n=1 Tax=Enterococcus innesii TaxID=2839759 RepID=UPI003B5970F9
MRNERQIIQDSTLGVEALLFNGIQQEFPNHWHEYYVIGLMEAGTRKFTCQNTCYIVEAGDLILIPPKAAHSCQQLTEEKLVYRNIHLTPENMAVQVQKIFNTQLTPHFPEPVICQVKEKEEFHAVHQLLLSDQGDEFEKQERFTCLLHDLLVQYADFTHEQTETTSNKAAVAKAYIDQHYAEKLSLSELSDVLGMNQYVLIRQFTKAYGLSPFQYLSTVRISAAKKKLEAQEAIAEVAFLTGFSDQSHFTRIFKSLIGVTPKAYQTIYQEDGVRTYE